MWDVFAVSTYATVSVLFWYLGMIPDLATARDQAKSKLKYAIYGMLSFGWRGASRHWKYHETASLLLAGLATPLVLSVHTVVSFDFTIAILPGWHSTIFPPYFVAGAIYSGFAMVLVLCIPLRTVYGLHNLITERHLNNCAKLMLATGLVLAYTYVIEPFTAWYSGNQFEMYTVWNRAFGPQSWTYWMVILFNVIIPQALWFKKVRIQAAAALRSFDGGAGWHVAGALHDHCHQPGSRLPAFVLEQLRCDHLGQRRTLWVCRPVHSAVLLVRPLPAYDFDV